MVSDNTILHPIAFASKSSMGTECRYSNIEREYLGILHGLEKFHHYCFVSEVPLGILHGLEKFHHYCFVSEVHVITDHKPFVAIFKKDIAILSQCIQCILLKIHQYRVQILYKPGTEIFTADWLSWHNHKEGKDEPI